MAHRGGFEPPTYWFVASYIGLIYHGVAICLASKKGGFALNTINELAIFLCRYYRLSHAALSHHLQTPPLTPDTLIMPAAGHRSPFTGQRQTCQRLCGGPIVSLRGSHITSPGSQLMCRGSAMSLESRKQWPPIRLSAYCSRPLSAICSPPADRGNEYRLQEPHHP